jgi:aarF domain-containing kinase
VAAWAGLTVHVFVYFQSLTDEFRVNYCKLWMSMIKADLEGIKKYATAMNAGDMYGLFACMLTGRSWKVISSGIDKQGYSKSEVSFFVLYSIYNI